MAASSSLAWPPLTKSIHGSQRGAIQMLDVSEEDNVSGYQTMVRPSQIRQTF